MIYISLSPVVFHISSYTLFSEVLASVMILGQNSLLKFVQILNYEGVVGWCEGVMYLMSLGRPADIGLQLGKACYPCSR